MKKMPYVFIVLISLHCTMVNASSLGVWPIDPRIEPPASATMVWVKNNSKTENVLLQARVFLWKQIDNKDQLIEQDDLVVSPPMIEVKPDAQQLFRVMNRSGTVESGGAEKSYRLLIDEIPRDEKEPNSILRFQMRYSLPLFVGSSQIFSGTEKPKLLASGLNYRLIKNPTPVLEIENNNSYHARLSRVTILSVNQAEKPTVISDGLLGYVLPNSVRQWPLNIDQFNALSQKDAILKFEQAHQELTIAAKD